MRLFIASPIILDDYEAIKKDFEGIIEGKWVEEEKLHLTWIFLSEHPSAQETIEQMSPLSSLDDEVEIAGLGYFGAPPRILYADAKQTMLYNKAREFKTAGFEMYRFKPHITLCRIEKVLDYKAYKEKVKSYKEKKLGRIKPGIILYESKRTSRGLEYQKIHEIKSASETT